MGLFSNLTSDLTKSLGIGGDVGKLINGFAAFNDKYTLQGLANNALNNQSNGTGASSSFSNEYSGPTSPYSMSTSSQNGSNFRTANFGYDSKGRPNALPFESIRDANGNVGSQYSLNAGPAVNLDTNAYNSYLGQAMGAGPTNGAQAALGLNKTNTMNNLNNANRAGATAQAGMFGNLQMTGGMSGAQRERVANNSAIDIMRERMNVLNSGNSSAANILSQDATNKTNMLANAQNMANQNAQFAQNERAYNTEVNKYNTGNLLNDVSNFNKYNGDMWNSSMSAWGANKTADAQLAAANASNQKSGLFGLGFGGL